MKDQEISIDVSTGEHDAGNRIFATLTGEKSGDTWLAIEDSRNFPTPPSGSELPPPEQIATVEERPAGPNLLIAGEKVCSWFGCEHTPTAQSIAAKINEATAARSMPAKSVSDEREEFEKWGNEHMLMGIDAPAWDATRNCYVDPSVHYMWKAWQARALLAGSSHAIPEGWSIRKLSDGDIMVDGPKQYCRIFSTPRSLQEAVFWDLAVALLAAAPLPKEGGEG